MLTLCIEDAVRAKFSPGDDPFTSIFADIAKGYPSVPRPELMAVLEKSDIPPRFSKIIRGLMEHARYRVKNNEGHSKSWFNMSLGPKKRMPRRTHGVINLPLLNHEGREISIVSEPR